MKSSAVDKYYEKAFDLILSGNARDAFDLEAEPDKVRAEFKVPGTHDVVSCLPPGNCFRVTTSPMGGAIKWATFTALSASGEPSFGVPIWMS